jgi:hypothetical protein
LCHWNIHPESNHFKNHRDRRDRAASCKKTSATSAQPPRISAVLDLIYYLQQVSVLTDVFLDMTV